MSSIDGVQQNIRISHLLHWASQQQIGSPPAHSLQKQLHGLLHATCPGRPETKLPAETKTAFRKIAESLLIDFWVTQRYTRECRSPCGTWAIERKCSSSCQLSKRGLTVRNWIAQRDPKIMQVVRHEQNSSAQPARLTWVEMVVNFLHPNSICANPLFIHQN